MKYLNILLIFGVVAVVASLAGWSPVLVFVSSGLAMIPLAGLMGEVYRSAGITHRTPAGRAAQRHVGQRRRVDHHPRRHPRGRGQPRRARAIVGAGARLADRVGAGQHPAGPGVEHPAGRAATWPQKFEQRHAGLNATMLMLAVAALVIPSIFSATTSSWWITTRSST